jgi:hypothetical protein
MSSHAQIGCGARPAVPRNRLGVATLVTFLAPFALIAAALFAAPAAQAAPAHYEGVSASGDVAVFSTTDKLVPGDTDIKSDVYVRELDESLGYVTRQVSLGATGGNDSYAAQFQAIDPAGDKVFFSTEERLTAADKDSAEDVYVRDLTTNKTTLVTAGDPSCAGSGCGNGKFDASAVSGGGEHSGVGSSGVVDEGNRVFFVSEEKLSAQDEDAGADIYVRDLEKGTTTLVSVAAPSCSGCGKGTEPVVFWGASTDGAKAIFTTAESLVGADSDEESDLYERNLETGETKLVSMPGEGVEPCPAASCEVSNSAISANGTHVFFETRERIVVGDSDKAQDVYDWSAGNATRVSTGLGGGNGESPADNALFEGSSVDGATVFFATGEQLSSADEDGVQDVYARSGGETELVSEGDSSCAVSECGNGTLPASLKWVSEDGEFAVVSTAEQLTAEDKDAAADVYERQLPGGPTTLLSVGDANCAAVDPECGSGPHNASFAGASADGSHLFFVTDEALAPPAEGEPSGPGDRDERTDAYDRSGDTTTWVSAGQLVGAGPFSGNGPFDTQLQGVSSDGSRAFMTTSERLTGEDDDLKEEDVYERSPSGTLLVSRGNDHTLEEVLAPPAPILEGTLPESPAASTEPKVYGFEEVEEIEGASIKLYTTVDCSGEPVATGSAEELEEGIAVTVAPGSTTSFHATAEAEGFISSCSAAVVYKQQSPAPPPEEESGGGGGGGGGQAPLPAAAPPRPSGGLLSLHTTPKTRITFGPAFKTRQRRPVFRFVDSTGQAGTSFVCKVDKSGWKRCSSPIKLKKQKRGKHLFEVRGVNAVGVWEERPIKRAFKLVRGR